MSDRQPNKATVWVLVVDREPGFVGQRFSSSRRVGGDQALESVRHVHSAERSKQTYQVGGDVGEGPRVKSKVKRVQNAAERRCSRRKLSGEREYKLRGQKPHKHGTHAPQ